MKIFAGFARLTKRASLAVMAGWIRSSGRQRRLGLALPSVLLIAIVGALLIATIFDIASRFGGENILFRRTYADQTTATSQIERAKGLIAAKIASDKEALHPTDGATWNTHPAIETLDDIQIFLNGSSAPDPLVVDNPLPDGRRVTMNVYDLTYVAAHVPLPSTTAEQLQRLLLPAPIDLTSMASTMGDWEVTQAVGDQTLGELDTLWRASGLDLRTFGAYLVRVEIFNRNGSLARRTEEAFFIRADRVAGP